MNAVARKGPDSRDHLSPVHLTTEKDVKYLKVDPNADAAGFEQAFSFIEKELADGEMEPRNRLATVMSFITDRVRLLYAYPYDRYLRPRESRSRALC
jgi:hypothetical protein